MSDSIPIGGIAVTPDRERATFIRRTYLHLALATLACAAVAALLIRWPGARGLIGAMTGGYNWLIVVGLFLAASSLADRWARVPGSQARQYLGLGLFALAQAIVLLPILYAAANHSSPDAIPTAGVLTLALFIGLTAVAFLTGSDFSFLRGALAIGGMLALGLVVASILFALAVVAYADGPIPYQTPGIVRDYRAAQRVASALGLSAPTALLFWSLPTLVQARR